MMLAVSFTFLTFRRVLASAVKRDQTAPDYKFHDDPYLIPYNSMRKRDFVMAKEGGRKSARYILDKHPELFMNNLVSARVDHRTLQMQQHHTGHCISEPRSVTGLMRLKLFTV